MPQRGLRPTGRGLLAGIISGLLVAPKRMALALEEKEDDDCCGALRNCGLIQVQWFSHNMTQSVQVHKWILEISQIDMAF